MRVANLFADGRDGHDGEPPPHAAAQSEDRGLPDARVLAVLHEERATEDGAVHGDERQEDAKRSVQCGGEFLDNHFHELDHGRDDRDEHDEAEEAQVDIGVIGVEPRERPFLEHVVLEEVVDGHGDAQHEDHREAEAVGGFDGFGHREVRTHAQEVGENHVLNEDALHEYAEVFHGLVFFDKCLVAAALNPNDDANRDQGHRRQNHQVVVLVEPSFRDEPARGQELHLPHSWQGNGPAAEDFTNDRDGEENPRITHRVADGVKERRTGLVAQRKCLEAAHDDAVGDDQSDEDGELLADVRLEGLQDLVHDDHERRHHHELDDDADSVWDEVAEQRDDDVAANHHEEHREAHDDGLLELDRDGQRRADAQHLHGDGVAVVQGVLEEFAVLLAEQAFTLGRNRGVGFRAHRSAR